MSSRLKAPPAVACLLAGLTLLPDARADAPAVAGTSVGPQAGADDGLQEIVVTAQKRSESLQSVPMSITALTNETLEERDVKSITDYANSIPNLSFGIGASSTNFGFAGSREIAIRGISGDDTTGFYLDDTPVPDSIDPHIVDVQRIEVLRGPQGTLYGARSMGGTVRVISTPPDAVNFSATTHAGVSTTDHTDRANGLADGTVNLPLIQNQLALRAEVYYEYDAGYFTRSSTGPQGTPALPVPSPAPFSVGNVGRSDTRGGALALLWQVNDALSVTPRILYQRNDYDGFPYADFYYDPSGPAPTLKPTSFDQQRIFNVGEGGIDEWSLSSLTVKYRTGIGELTSSTSYFRRDIAETENQTEFVDLNFFLPAGAAPVPSIILESTRMRRYVQEVRFASELRGPLQFVAGAYYSDTYGNFSPGNDPPAIAPGLNAASGGALGSDVVFTQYNHQKISEPALYGEIYWNVLESLKLTGGLRAYRIDTTNVDFQDGAATGGTPLSGARQTLSAQGINPKYEVDYQLTPEHMTYASVSKGFRPGALQPAVPASPALGCGPQLAQIGLTLADTRAYRADSLWNYEIGSKNSWDGNRLLLNGAAYTIRWNDIQQLVPLPCGFGFTTNAGAAKSEGAELEAQWRPLHGLDLSAGAGYEHAVITQKGLSPQLPGSPVYMVPDWTGNLQAAYTQDLNPACSLVYNLGYSYVGNRKSGNNNPFEPRLLPAYGLLDGNIGVKWSQYELLLVGKNLTNTIASYGDGIAISAELPGRPRVLINQPRTIGFEFRTTF